MDIFRDLVDPQTGALEVWIRCLDTEQYFGMASADLYLRAANRPFWVNFVKGYVSIWFQMVVVTCFGVAFSTFLSGPVAMLATLAALVMGFFKGFVFDVASGEMPGGGPLESLVRLFTQKNQLVELEKGLDTTVIQLIDGIFLQVMQAVSYAMPDCGKFNTSRFVAYGFDIPHRADGTALGGHVGLRHGARHRRLFLLQNSRDRGMISQASFVRKIIYGVIIALLLIPMYLISRPALRDPRNPEGPRTEGGVLAQLRNEHRLSQAVLGEIDPASESMKLATLGMRGIAANLLWERANRYKREHDWDSLAATLNQISKLQPNFISVWQFQGWNLAYNVSIEFDDYRSRYHWIKRGIDFLRDGIRYNSEEPILDWEIGWTFGHKLGKADEYVQYRRLFREDSDYHDDLSANISMDNTVGPDNRPDNWLAGRQWFLKGEELVESGVPIRGRLVDDTGRIKRGKTPLLFHSYPPKWLINHAVAIEEEGYLDETAQYAWMKAGEQWNAYGDRPIPTSYGFAIRLNDGERLQKEESTSGGRVEPDDPRCP